MKKIVYIKGEKIKNCEYLNDVLPINGIRAAQFKCHCGNIFTCRISSIKDGKTSSCGCIHREILKKMHLTHGQSIGNETPEYRSWTSMNSRCNNPNTEHYEDYGGRGIFVDERWKDFSTFFNDMGVRPSLKHSLERRDNNKGYSKENCYWATKKEQTNNRRNNIMINYCGKTQNLKQWTEELGLKYKQTWKRIYVFKWSVSDAFTTPCNKIIRLLTYKGKTQGLTEWAKELGISAHQIRGRLNSLGLSVEEALDAKSRAGNNGFTKKKSA